MQRTQIAIVFAASVLAGVITLVACGDDNATTPLPGGGSSTSGNGTSGKSSSGSQGDDDDTTGDDDTQGDDDDDTVGDAGVDAAACSKAPRLRKTELGFFCSFYDGGTGDSGTGGRSNCGNEDVCCNPGKDGDVFPNSYCADKGTNGQGVKACENGAATAESKWIALNGTAWECASATACGGKKCCAYSAPGADGGNLANVGNSSDTAIPKACGAKQLYKSVGSKCADACKTDKTEVELCSATDGCGGGKTCVPVRAQGNKDLGACL